MLRTVIFSLCFLFANSAFALEKGEFQKEINEIIRSPSFKSQGYSLLFFDPSEKEEMLSINATTPLVPASNVKVATTIAALKLLGLDYQFKTGFYYDGNLEQGILNGNLYIKGGGDPSIYLETMYLLAQRLKKMGIRKITGNIYGDDSFFDKKKHPIGWTEGESNEPYLAMISALSFNFNSVEIAVSPSPNGNGTVSIIEPELPDYILIDNVHLDPQRKTRISIRSERNYNETAFYVEGLMKPDEEQKFFYETIPDPSRFFIASFRKYLDDVGIIVEGRTLLRKTPNYAKQLFIHKSKVLPLVLRDMNKFSSNFIANQLVKTIAAEKLGVPGSFVKGITVIMNFFSQIGLNTRNIKMVDGSGLSSKNRMTAEFIVNLLKYAYNDLSLYPEVANSFSIMGVDGSVKRWEVDESIFGKIRVKTGTLSRAVSLSGYTQLDNGKVIIFAMIFNDFACCVYKIRDLEKKILLTLLQSQE